MTGLRATGRAPQAGREAHRARGVLVVAEVAVAVVLVSGALLVVNSLWRLPQAPLGFQAADLFQLESEAERAAPKVSFA